MRIIDTKDFVTLIENFLDQDLCDEIITKFNFSREVNIGKVVHPQAGHSQNTDKVSFDLTISHQGEWRDIYNCIHESVAKALAQYLPHFPSLQLYPIEGSGFKIQKYLKHHGHFTWHYDGSSPQTYNRLFALIIYLNDVESGGETMFYYQQRKIIPVRGHGILFPTSWTHMHCGCIPESGDKYIISSFFQYKMS